MKQILAEVMTIGDELLIGQVVDTNSAWIGQQLSLNGIRVKQITSVSDDPAHIVEALRDAASRADIILITGGLGPTKDDLTKKTLRDYFGMGWRMDEAVLANVTRIFAGFGREVTEVNRLQAQVPDGCIALMNKNGTAPGMWFEQNGKIYVSMPGVPFEMKGLMTDSVLPKLREKFGLPVIIHKTILTQGIGESMLAERIEAWEDSLAAEGIKLAYLPSPSMVRLRLSATGDDREKVVEAVERKTRELIPQISSYVFGYGDETIEGVVGSLLREKKQTVSTAESCTGGMIAHMITSVPGSSDYFTGSIISYANQVKSEQLGVSEGLLAQYGAVSEECVRAMAESVREKLHTDYSIATSGIAGPGGGTPEKPVGLVWIAVAGPGRTYAKSFFFGDNRERNIVRASITALALLRKMVIGELE
jgi:nicotinamide-nucleotide amidase